MPRNPLQPSEDTGLAYPLAPANWPGQNTGATANAWQDWMGRIADWWHQGTQAQMWMHPNDLLPLFMGPSDMQPIPPEDTRSYWLRNLIDNTLQPNPNVDPRFEIKPGDPRDYLQDRLPFMGNQHVPRPFTET
jgi:hypothetical protein